LAAKVPSGRAVPGNTLGLSQSPSCQRASAPAQAPRQMGSTGFMGALWLSGFSVVLIAKRQSYSYATCRRV